MQYATKSNTTRVAVTTGRLSRAISSLFSPAGRNPVCVDVRSSPPRVMGGRPLPNTSPRDDSSFGPVSGISFLLPGIGMGAQGMQQNDQEIRGEVCREGLGKFSCAAPSCWAGSCGSHLSALPGRPAGGQSQHAEDSGAESWDWVLRKAFNARLVSCETADLPTPPRVFNYCVITFAGENYLI